MPIEGDDFRKRLDAKDDQLFRLGDVIDVKASIGLVVITFLATQTADFLKDKAVGPALHYVQLVSAISLAVAGLLALIELWPRDYQMEKSEGLAEWEKELRDHFKHDPDADAKVAEAFTKGQNRRTEERITNNGAINELKSSFLIWSFRCVALAFALNMVTLVVKAAG